MSELRDAYDAIRADVVAAIQSAWSPDRIVVEAPWRPPANAELPYVWLRLDTVTFGFETPVSDEATLEFSIGGVFDAMSDADAVTLVAQLRAVLLTAAPGYLPEIREAKWGGLSDARDDRSEIGVRFRCRISAPRLIA